MMWVPNKTQIPKDGSVGDRLDNNEIPRPSDFKTELCCWVFEQVLKKSHLLSLLKLYPAHYLFF